jgi:maltose alpha-D-glucosyltransferase/alpha-amylase
MPDCRKPKKSSTRPNQKASKSWYKDAVIYQLHVRAFFDSNNDGVGDFRGLTQKLDYIKDLGVSAIWLLPFYKSPLRDDGYDISDYKEINPAYGTLDDFRHFVEQAHDRDIRVITELVINHSSEQHPWFQRARRAPPGSPERDYYVWSDTGHEFEEARIIFLDSEVSNWTWDPIAKAYYWHRFYNCQPDLNFDNPLVVREVKDILNFWLDMGVDGFRLDAVPYLVEREGTTGENLRETHSILKVVRAEVERRRPNCVLLAEANQPPERTVGYFGRGDECQMAFHFPLMPRLFMALAQEDREPIVEIVERTRSIPDDCQWALFLRNHDELTLEMVTEDERDYLWHVYATHRRLRINLGIRRRLATLLNGDRRRIELMNSLLFSLNGSPVLYYGDEIGMGDNPFLGDRDGVRTPMQWSPDRNAGFSTADYVDLYLPPIEHRFYGYDLVNVAEQRKMRSSLLNWTRWMIRVRQSHPAFARGDIAFLQPTNQKVLAYVRRHGEEVLLCVVNLCETAQAAQLDLSPWAGRIPVEVFGGCPFPAVAKELPYPITLPGHEFLWLKLYPAEQVDPVNGVPGERMDRPDLPAPDRPSPRPPGDKERQIGEARTRPDARLETNPADC